MPELRGNLRPAFLVSIGNSLYLSIFLFFSWTAIADVSLPPIFGDHMVLQRDVTVPVWGNSSPGERVSVSFGNLYEQTVADSSGKWRIMLPALAKSSQPQSFIINAKNRIELHDVIVGDVWICAGEGNMAFPLAKTPEWEDPHGLRSEERIRFYIRDNDVIPIREKGGHWVVCTRDKASVCSAVGYFFARDLWSSQHIPIGMIQCTKTDSPISSWFSGASSISLAKLNDHSVYKELIAPIVSFSIAGVIWYQGESDRGLSVLRYRVELQRLIKEWRKRWALGPFPFFAVTPAGYGESGAVAVDLYSSLQGDSTGSLPWLRESIATMLTLPMTGVAVADDLGMPEELFPNEKLLVGRRLALLARHRFYGEMIRDTGPVCKEVRIEGDKIRVIFETFGSSLTLGVPPSVSDSFPFSLATSLKGFAIRGDGTKWFAAKGVIDGRSVLLSCPTVPHPKFVRYNWKDFPEGNLYSEQGLPVASFRTDLEQPNKVAQP